MLRHVNMQRRVSEIVYSKFGRCLTGFTNACTWEDDSFTLILIRSWNSTPQRTPNISCWVFLMLRFFCSSDDWMCLYMVRKGMCMLEHESINIFIMHEYFKFFLETDHQRKHICCAWSDMEHEPLHLIFIISFNSTPNVFKQY